MSVESIKRYKNVFIITDTPFSQMERLNPEQIIMVKDLKKTFFKFTSYYRHLFNIPVVAITGTCGKSTTKEMLKYILEETYNVQATLSSKNADYYNLAYLMGIDENHYKINNAELISSINEKQLIDLISQKIQEQVYLIQQFITSQTKSGHVFDFRLHVQKNGEGKWVITSIYPRIGRLGTITSNMGSGGYSTFLDIFLKTEFGDSWYDIQRYLEEFALKFPKHFDSLYDNVLDELGIDVGIDENQKLWLFEVNWRPGPPYI